MSKKRFSKLNSKLLDFLINALKNEQSEKIPYYLHPTAKIGLDTTIWDLSVIREESSIGSNCMIGRNVYVGPRVTIGDSTRIQDHVLIYQPAKVGQHVFIGPGSILTNDTNPEIRLSNGAIHGAAEWTPSGVIIEDYVTIGASVTVLPGVRIEWGSFIGAGSVVTRDIPRMAVAFGVPARVVGYRENLDSNLRKDFK